MQSSFEDFNDYLKSLQMVATAHEFNEFEIPRISQLTQRSNQFNLRTIRYTEAEIEEILRNDKYLTLSFSLKDKFGDYGLISVVIMEKKDKETLFLDTWLMSCRVLKRGMEEFIINTIIETAKKKGFKKVVGEYIKTPKNAMVEKIYSNLGFKEVKKDLFEAEVDNFSFNKTNIKLDENNIK